MTYLVAAYGITAASLVFYAVGMLRERVRLQGGTPTESENTTENSRIK